jgi:hypothetical protein
MKKVVDQTVSVSLGIAVLVLALAIMPSVVNAYEPGMHPYIAEEAKMMYESEVGEFPALDRDFNLVKEGSMHEDEVDHIWGHEGLYVTCSHFWDPDIANLSENNDFAGTPVGNAYMKANELLDGAFEFHTAQDYVNWWEYFGHITHLIGDMTVPAHTHIDSHDFESFEKCWILNNDKFREFTHTDAEIAGGLVDIPEGRIQFILAHEAQGGGYGLGYDPRMYAKLYYLMYTTAQVGDWFPSDDGSGDNDDRHTWMDYSNFPGTPRTADDLDNNWWYQSDEMTYYCDNSDGDFTRIAQTSFVHSIRGVASLYLAFRDAFDGICPTTTAALTYSQPPPYSDWTNGPVTITLSAQDDISTRHISQVYETYWGKFELLYTEPIFVSEEGIHEIKYFSMDWFGNKEPKNTATVKIDMTPPEITFPDLNPNYLTSDNFIATWVATDALSGVHGEYALLDGQMVTKEQVIDLSQLAGKHRLEVYAEDEAGNLQYAFYDFEVWIDADGWCFSVLINNKTRGNAMSCVVEFPAPYDVGLIDLTTSTLAVKGTLNLTQSDPIIGETAELPTQLLTGVGYHDWDLIPDRMLQFAKNQFVVALAGQTGNIESIISGGLLPNEPSEQPRFIANVTVPVFKSTKK